MNENSEGIWNFIIKIAQRDAIKSIFKTKWNLREDKKKLQIKTNEKFGDPQGVPRAVVSSQCISWWAWIPQKNEKKENVTQILSVFLSINTIILCAL